MKDCRLFYIDGKWVNPIRAHDFNVINPANEEPIATITLGTAADADMAVAAAKRAFECTPTRLLISAWHFCSK